MATILHMHVQRGDTDFLPVSRQRGTMFPVAGELARIFLLTQRLKIQVYHIADGEDVGQGAQTASCVRT